MATPLAGSVRLLRTAVLAAVLLVLSSAAHVIAGGQLPGPGPFALLAAAVTAECAVLTRWRLSPQALIAVMAASQFLLHEALMALAMPASSAVSPSLHGGMSQAIGIRATQAHGAMPSASGTISLLMLACHAAAALALAGVLAFGEDAVWQLWCWLAPATLQTLWRAITVPEATGVRMDSGATLPKNEALLSGNPRRGPPVARTA